MAQEGSRVVGVVRGAVFTVAGLADVAYRQAQHVLADFSLVAPPPDAEGGLERRGSALLRRWTMPPEHHMEVMARRVARAAKDPGHG